MYLKLKKNSLKNLIKYHLKRNSFINRYFREEKSDRTYGSLNDDQMRYIDAFSRAVYPPSGKKEKMQLCKIVFKWTKERTEIDGYFEEYDEFVDIIKTKTQSKYTNQKFYELSPDEIIKLLYDLYQKSDLYDIPASRSPSKLFIFIIHFMINRKKYYQNFVLKTVRKDIINGIYSSELGYSFVGFHSTSGVKGKYTDYTELPGINGARGKSQDIQSGSTRKKSSFPVHDCDIKPHND